MSAAILIVEHEPRYADRMKEALAGHPVDLHFARDGEEALHIVDQHSPQLIILSSVIPKISTADLIRQIKSRSAGPGASILITVSGYTGKNPKADAMRLGADDIVPKPFADSVFAEKVQQLIALQAGPKLTSSEIFGDVLNDSIKPAEPHRPFKKAAQPNIDELLEQTLSGIRTPGGVRKKTEGEPPAAAPKRPTSSGIDRRVQDTLSGLEKSVHARQPVHRTNPGDSAPPPPPIDEKVMVSVPVLQPIDTIKEQPDDASPDRFGQYTLIERIARGGMAEVWKARMRGVEGFEKIVAIKKILPHLSEDADFVNMFIDEAKLAAQLNHNNIIHIYDLGKIGGSYYIAMEYVEGHDLKDILRRGAERDLPMPIDLALFVASKIAAALDYAHRKRDFEQKELGIVHRDVSPQNVLISSEGDIKLCDFGIAKAASKVSHTKAGALKGKLQYMSPEQAWGKSIDRRSDLFALASVLFEMLTARKLFNGDNEISVLEEVREAHIQPPSHFHEEVTPQVDQVVLRALQRDPEERYQTAGEMAREIDSILYTFRPTPTSADLAIYLDRLYAEHEEPLLSAPPLVEAPPPAPLPPAPVPVAQTQAPAPIRSHAPVHPAVAEPGMFGGTAPRKRKLAIPIAAGLLIAAAAAGTVFVLTRKETAAATPVPVSVAQRQSQPREPVSEPVPVAAPPLTETLREFAPAAGTETVDEQTIINEEVRRRLATERQRLDQQRAQQLAAQQAAERPQRTSPAPRTERESVAPLTQTVPPPITPVQTESEEPAASEATTSTPAATNQQVPIPPPQEAAPSPAAKQGDFVGAGTPGLVEPVLVSMKKVPYPPIAKMHKVSGNVIVSVLVSETGRVLEAKILRGISQNVGINEAALEMARGATFQPATKDGVRVKANKTLVVPFKL